MSNGIQRANFLSEAIADKISKLKKGDNISVLWIDASQCRNVPMKPKLSNHNVETTCMSSGWFYGIQSGEVHHDQFILIVKGSVDGDRISVESVPLCLVKEIDVFKKTELMSIVNGHKTRIRYSDGSVKEVLGGTLVVDHDSQRKRNRIERKRRNQD